MVSEAAASHEIGNPLFSATGTLGWVPLSLACYQSSDLRGGKFLLFDPAAADRPLEELSLGLLNYINSATDECPPLYFPDDLAGTMNMKQFWRRLAGMVRVTVWRNEIRDYEARRAEADEACRQAASPPAGDSGVRLDPEREFSEATLAAERCLESGGTAEASSAYGRACGALLECLCESSVASDGSIENQLRQLQGRAS